MKNLNVIFSHPTSLFTLLAILLLVFGAIKIRKVKLSTQMITQIGIALALATVLKIFRLYHLPQGGSVTIGSMVPILLIGLFYGAEVGYLTGFIYGIITLIMDPYILQPVQVLFDYPLPFMALGIIGYFRNHKILGAIIAIFARFLCHFISGVAFFGSYAPKGMSAWVYSLIANGTFIGIEGVICIVIIGLLPVERLYTIAAKKPYSMPLGDDK